MTVQAGTSVNSVAEIGFAYQTWGGTNPLAAVGYQITSNSGVGAGALTFSTRSVTTDTAPTERARITSTGDFGISGNAGSATNRLNLTYDGGSGVASVGPNSSGGSTILFFGTSNSGVYSERARIDSNGNIICNTAAIATNATNGFLYVPGCAGTPTGTPTTVTGRSPIVVDTTNNKLYFYSGGQWRDAGP
jgi:hypothetical protein